MMFHCLHDTSLSCTESTFPARPFTYSFKPAIGTMVLPDIKTREETKHYSRRSTIKQAVGHTKGRVYMLTPRENFIEALKADGKPD